MGVGPVERMAIERDRARLVLQRAADAIDQRALARAVGSDEADALARIDRERDAIERDKAAEALAEIVDGEQFGRGSRHGSGHGSRHGTCPVASALIRWRPTWPAGRCLMYFCTSPMMP